MKQKRFLAILLMVVLATCSFMAVACTPQDQPIPDPEPDVPVPDVPTPDVPTTITLNKTSLKLYEGSGAKIVATVSDGTRVTYSSSNTQVASVSSAGEVLAKSVGTAVITATAGTATATCDVEVVADDSTSASFVLPSEPIQLSLKEYDDYRPTCDRNQYVTFIDSSIDSVPTFQSDNESVFTVDADGTLTAKSAGTANVTVTLGNYSDTAEVSVYTMCIHDSATWLDMVNNHFNEKQNRYLVTNDIDMSAVAYETKAMWLWDSENQKNDITAFSGELDGNGYTVSNITWTNASHPEQSVFGFVASAYIHDISFVKVTFAGERTNDNIKQCGLAVVIGAPVDENVTKSKIENVFCDFVYTTNNTRAICDQYRNCDINNVFVQMSSYDGLDLNQNCGYGFASKIVNANVLSISNVVVYHKGGSLTLETTGQEDGYDTVEVSLPVLQKGVFMFDELVEACNKAGQLFDQSVWNLNQDKLPTLW